MSNKNKHEEIRNYLFLILLICTTASVGMIHINEGQINYNRTNQKFFKPRHLYFIVECIFHHLYPLISYHFSQIVWLYYISEQTFSKIMFFFHKFINTVKYGLPRMSLIRVSKKLYIKANGLTKTWQRKSCLFRSF